MTDVAQNPELAGLALVLDPEPTDALRRALVACWVDVTNAGGAVGFVPPVTEADVLPLADRTFARLTVAGGEDHLLVARDGAGALVGWLILESRGVAVCDHWRTLRRVQIHPDHQGRGYGGALMRGAERAARTLGMEALHLTVRDGTGIDSFYRRLGYVQVGRVPRALRLAPDDVRDELYMVHMLEDGPG